MLNLDAFFFCQTSKDGYIEDGPIYRKGDDGDIESFDLT